MKIFICRFQRDFEVEIAAPDLKVAEVLARDMIAVYPKGTAKMLSLIPEGYVEPAVPPKPPTAPRGHPHGGGTPGPTIVKVPVLVDQIAKVA